ncbi:MAG TPA: hypothetical protein VK589_23960 [Chryseolinea sp.]|nr:hypothetical protein [Chryseolinea sp.]
MKSIDWLSLTRLKMSRVLGIVAVVVFAFACSDGSEDVAGPPADASAKKNNALNGNTNGNCESKEEDYALQVYNDGTYWKYTITLAPGAKAVSHFIIDLNNCPDPTSEVAIANFQWAKVNGVNWLLSSSEGDGTGCNVSTDNIVKFDNLPEAQVYVIEFNLDHVFGNVLLTTGWLKAGCSCHVLEDINGPCCG